METGWTGLPEGSSASDASEEGVHSIPEGPHEQGGIWAEWAWAKPFLGIIFLTQGFHPCSSFSLEHSCFAYLGNFIQVST